MLCHEVPGLEEQGCPIELTGDWQESLRQQLLCRTWKVQLHSRCSRGYPSLQTEWDHLLKNSCWEKSGSLSLEPSIRKKENCIPGPQMQTLKYVYMCMCVYAACICIILDAKSMRQSRKPHWTTGSFTYFYVYITYFCVYIYAQIGVYVPCEGAHTCRSQWLLSGVLDHVLLLTPIYWTCPVRQDWPGQQGKGLSSCLCLPTRGWQDAPGAPVWMPGAILGLHDCTATISPAQERLWEGVSRLTFLHLSTLRPSQDTDASFTPATHRPKCSLLCATFENSSRYLLVHNSEFNLTPKQATPKDQPSRVMRRSWHCSSAATGTGGKTLTREHPCPMRTLETPQRAQRAQGAAALPLVASVTHLLWSIT